MNVAIIFLIFDDQRIRYSDVGRWTNWIAMPQDCALPVNVVLQDDEPIPICLYGFP
jgi:hypothetical protein